MRTLCGESGRRKAEAEFGIRDSATGFDDVAADYDVEVGCSTVSFPPPRGQLHSAPLSNRSPSIAAADDWSRTSHAILECKAAQQESVGVDGWRSAFTGVPRARSPIRRRLEAAVAALHSPWLPRCCWLDIRSPASTIEVTQALSPLLRMDEDQVRRARSSRVGAPALVPGQETTDSLDELRERIGREGELDAQFDEDGNLDLATIQRMLDILYKPARDGAKGAAHAAGRVLEAATEGAVDTEAADEAEVADESAP
ncbi:hypothetical protein L1887_56030 [Cichorium endivia]|nr:hypothetical protein L1887_56030 [Cichorium endivia]